MGFYRPACWSGLPFPSAGDLPDPGIKPTHLMSPALADGFFTTSTTWEALIDPQRESESRSVVSDSLQPHGLYKSMEFSRILEWVAMPSSKGVFSTQGLNPGLPHCRQILHS